MVKYILLCLISINLYTQNINNEIINLHKSFKKVVYTDFEKALFNAEKSVKKSNLIKNNDLLLTSYLNLSEIYLLQRKFNDSKTIILKALKIANDLNYINIKCKLNINLGHIYTYEDKLNKALTVFENNLVIAKKNNLNKRTCDLYINLANLYRINKKSIKAINTYKKSITLSSKANYYKGLAKAYNGLAYLKRATNIDSAFIYHKKALEIAKRTNNKYLESVISLNLGDLYLTQNQYNNGLKNLKQSEEVINKVKNYYLLHYLYLSKGIYYEKKHNNVKAIENYELAINKYGKYIDGHQLMHSYWLVSGVYEHTNDFEKANFYLNKHIELNDSLMNITRIKEFEQLRTKYEVEKKDNKIILLTKEKQLEKSKKNNIIIGASGVLAILLLLTYFLRNKIKTQKIVQKNRQKLFTQELKTKKALSLIEGQENERNRLAKELHDGLGGQLAGVKSIIQTISTDNIQEKTIIVNKHLSSSIKSLRNISHDLSATFLKNKDFDVLIQQLIKQSFENKTIQTEISIFPSQKINELSERYKLNIYRVLQESFQNIIKHAKANFVSVSILIDEEINMLIEDNGIGFNTNIKTNGIGLQNIKDRIQSLNGTLHVDSELNKGTTLNINIPYND